MNNEGVLYWLWLSERCGAASKDFGKLMKRYESPYDLYRLEEEELEGLDGISDRLKQRLSDKNLDFAYRTKYECAKKGIKVIPYGDKRYPERLRSLEDPPVLLYVLGELPNMDRHLCIGMVGTRKMSEYGRHSAYKISYELAAAGAVIVSGMAGGVDGVCAAGALAANGTTVAVLGNGLSVVYPKEHDKLMRAIGERGAVISEYPLSEPPYGGNFPKRNRIISGLCQGVLVIEGPDGSGALITATLAQKQGRDLFALPGKIDDKGSKVPNDLIRMGAEAATCSEDVLDFYSFLYMDKIDYGKLRKAIRQPYPEELALEEYAVKDTGKTERARKKSVAAKPSPCSLPAEETANPRGDQDPTLESLDPVWRRVLEAMPISQPVSADALAVDGVSASDVITAMTMLEIEGFCEALPGGMFLRK